MTRRRALETALYVFPIVCGFVFAGMIGLTIYKFGYFMGSWDAFSRPPINWRQ